jgi:small GTP-binding protein
MSSKRRNKGKEEEFDYLQKIIIIGDSGVGKSNVLLRYSEGKFVENYMMTIGINYMFKVTAVDGVRIKLQIWDTAGQDKYKTITQNYYRNSDGVLIVFGLDSRESFHSVRTLLSTQATGSRTSRRPSPRARRSCWSATSAT